MPDINVKRCFWVNLNNQIYVRYHDCEWGVPTHSDNELFEMLILETFQAGLSWECILNKRECFRAAFDGFDADKISKYDDAKVSALMSDTGIIRNRRKILASINNSRVFLDIQREFGTFDAYIWSFTDGKVIYESCDIRTTSPLSDAVSADLKRRGMRFVGSTIIYSYLQSIGIINAHVDGCYLYHKDRTER